MSVDSTKRFSDRVEDYVRYRPGYPRAVLDWLHDHGIAPDAVVADIGAGTGILTRLFLEGGHQVLAVEPNRAMRAAAEVALAGRPGFTAIDGTAEATTLDDGAIDLIAAGQAFHWFDPDAARREFARIGRPDALVVLVWNDRDVDATPAMRAYEELLERWGTDYRDTTYRHRALEETYDRFFAGSYQTATFANAQRLDEAGLIGRFFSSSYTPAREDARYADAERAARAMFGAHADGGSIELTYVTRLYLGSVAG